MIRLLFLALILAASLMGNPCDSNPRITGTVTMTCQATPYANGSFIQVHIQSANTQTVNVSTEIGWRTPASAGRMSKIIRILQSPFDGFATFTIPEGAVIEFVQVEENARISAAGFTQ